MTEKKPQRNNDTGIPFVSAEVLKDDPEPQDGAIPLSKKKNNFPAKKRHRPAKILPSHRVIFESYKEQGFRFLGKAIRKTGIYSESVAHRPHVITKSKSWKMLMDEYLPDEMLSQRHAEVLNKRDTKVVKDADGNEELIDNGPETAAVTKGLDMAYRLRGSYKENEAPPPSTVMYNLIYKPEVRAQMKTFEEGIKQSLVNEVARKNQKDMEDEQETERLRAESEGTPPAEGGN